MGVHCITVLMLKWPVCKVYNIYNGTIPAVKQKPPGKHFTIRISYELKQLLEFKIKAQSVYRSMVWDTIPSITSEPEKKENVTCNTVNWLLIKIYDHSKTFWSSINNKKSSLYYFCTLYLVLATNSQTKHFFNSI